MQSFYVFGKNIEKYEEIKEKFIENGFTYDKTNPELIICYGGDGTFLIAERMYPSIPKILIKGSEISNKGIDMDIEKIVQKYKSKEFSIDEIKKLKAHSYSKFGEGELTGVNDIVIRNTLPTEAIRFRLKANGKEINKELIGDGIVIATAYGSRAYFYSITKEKFEKGIGIAFSNLTQHHDFILLEELDKIEVEITRGLAVMVADNNRNFINLEEGDKIIIEQTEQVAKRIIFW